MVMMTTVPLITVKISVISYSTNIMYIYILFSHCECLMTMLTLAPLITVN